jgi:hypothetical protein
MKKSAYLTCWIARLLLGVFLFAQGVVAANACDVLGGNIAQVFAAAENTEPCHDETSSNANACLDHCTQGDRISVDQITPDFIPPSTLALRAAIATQTFVLPLTPDATLTLNTGPPISIRFCSFQI